VERGLCNVHLSVCPSVYPVLRTLLLRCGFAAECPTGDIDRLLHGAQQQMFGERAFSRAGPATWNALPDHIRTVADPVKFRKLLKSHYFSQAFNTC